MPRSDAPNRLQSPAIAYLSRATSHAAPFEDDGPVEIVETHGAYVFLCGQEALKMKRAVHYDYMDLSTPDLRRDLLLRELELNAPAAPQIYRDVRPILRAADGTLSLGAPLAQPAPAGGNAPACDDPEIIDWVLRMWRFPAEDELEAIAERGAFDEDLASATGEVLARYHAAAPVRRDLQGSRLMSDILDEFTRVFAEFPGAPGTEGIDEILGAARRSLADISPLLDQRARDGHVRRGHGDLHLRNLVLIGGTPVPFDALEFDEVLGTCDVLYDIAFLIMDLCHRDLPLQACRVLDAWLRAADGTEDAGLAALPLFLAVRAVIRAMTTLQGDAARGNPGASTPEIAGYLSLACRALQPAPARLVAVGGFSGSGKSILARALPPALGALPGAVLLSSDLERKARLAASSGHLPRSAYSEARRTAVYTHLFARAATLLRAGHSVVLDATFIDPALRDAARATAATAGTDFTGLWLSAPDNVLHDRVARRRNGPSDADTDVLARQLATGPGALDWQLIDADCPPGICRATALEELGL